MHRPVSLFLLVAATTLALAGRAVSNAATADPGPDAGAVVAAERAFAADGRAMGLDRSFLKWSAPDAVQIVGGAVVRPQEILDPAAVVDPAAPVLAWWPVWAGVAASGDLGFTTGPAEIGGRRFGCYFTIWRRQADGGWRWVYDGGSGADPEAAPGPDSEPVLLPVATVGSASPEAAMAEVAAAEAALAVAAAVDQRAAHLAVLAPDGRLYVTPLPPAIDAVGHAAALTAWPAVFRFEPPTGGGASAAGDLVWTYGRAAWRRDVDRAGWYVHLWQKRADGWKLAFAQLVPAPPASPPPPAGG